MRYGRLTAVAAIACLLAWVTQFGTASADAPGTAGTTFLMIEPPAPGRTPDMLQITARLVGPGGQPLSGARVEFLVDVDLPAAERTEEAKPMQIGVGATDATGGASIQYRPTWNGVHILTARFAGDGVQSSATARLSIDVAGVASPVPAATTGGLGSLGDNIAIVVGALVVTVWLSLAFIAVRTVAGIVLAGRDGERARARDDAPVR